MNVRVLGIRNLQRFLILSSFFSVIVLVLAGVAQWFECQPVNQRVASSIPSLGHIPGLQARSPAGGAQEATTH